MFRLPFPQQALRQVGLSGCDSPPFLLLGAPMRNQPRLRSNILVNYRAIQVRDSEGTVYS